MGSSNYIVTRSNSGELITAVFGGHVHACADERREPVLFHGTYAECLSFCFAA